VVRGHSLRWAAEPEERTNEQTMHKGDSDDDDDNNNNNKQNTFHGRNNITSSTNCKFRTAATLHTPATRFVSSI
jgi:hypothetical protein